MRLLVTIDLSKADLALFEAYEAEVLKLVPEHGGRLDLRVRTVDGSTETHLLSWPDAAALAAYRTDPRRIAMSDKWVQSGATSSAVEVRDIP